ncbi:MAG: FAD-dependent oxidoreductase, partial [Pseudomonadota bacterium]
MAAGRLLEHLVADDTRYEITLFNAEPRGTYNRLMLSPVLAGDTTYEQIITHDADWYRRHRIAARLGERVERIDLTAKVVHGAKGPVPYDKLVIATGSTPFMIPLPGH